MSGFAKVLSVVRERVMASEEFTEEFRKTWEKVAVFSRGADVQVPVEVNHASLINGETVTMSVESETTDTLPKVDCCDRCSLS